MKKTVCHENLCTGCNACMNICKKDALRKADNGLSLNVYIDSEKCINCGLCEKVCPIVNGCTFREPSDWIQGMTKDPEARRRSTSGAYAYEISRAFIEKGGWVAGCCFSGGDFSFRIINRVEELKKFCGSKYVKSDTGSVFSEIKELLKNGEKVLFTGLPCQSAGLQRFVGRFGEKLGEKLYTMDLICHGTPSVKVLDVYLGRYGISRGEVSQISFRNGPLYELGVDGRTFEKTNPGADAGSLEVTEQDEYLDNTSDDFSDAFLKRLNHLEGCYSCLFKRPQRISDISVGDAWGTEHSKEEMQKGISLALPTTDKGLELLQAANVTTEPIDKTAVLKTNDQLEYPWPKPVGRDAYLEKFLK